MLRLLQNLLIIPIFFGSETVAFQPNQCRNNRRIETSLSVKPEGSTQNIILPRRLFIQTCSVGAALVSSGPSYASEGKLPSLLSQVKEARAQLEPVTGLIKEEKWDSVRAILITPPISDCWSKTSKLLNSYAQAIGDELPDGDEFAALEFKEEALDHLRFLDMAVYNNVFNPIKSEGETGATKELIRSYYEDPVNEYKACVRAFDGLIELAK